MTATQGIFPDLLKVKRKKTTQNERGIKWVGGGVGGEEWASSECQSWVANYLHVHGRSGCCLVAVWLAGKKAKEREGSLSLLSAQATSLLTGQNSWRSLPFPSRPPSKAPWIHFGFSSPQSLHQPPAFTRFALRQPPRPSLALPLQSPATRKIVYGLKPQMADFLKERGRGRERSERVRGRERGSEKNAPREQQKSQLS